MRTVSVSELKARLSHCLGRVKRGVELYMSERWLHVGPLMGLDRSFNDQRRDRLVRSGMLRADTGDASWILNEPLVRSQWSLSEAVDQDRTQPF